jgi:hypothetical protein
MIRFLIINAIVLQLFSACQKSVDTVFIPDEVEGFYLIREARGIRNTLTHYLGLDYLIENTEINSIEDKIKVQVYKEQNKLLLEQALHNYRSFTNQYPASKLFHVAQLNKGLIEFDLLLYDSATKTFTEILESNLRDDQEVYTGYSSSKEPFSIHRRTAADKLYEIKFEEGDFYSAKKYLLISEETAFSSFCGNAYDQREYWLTIQKSKIEYELSNYDQAASLLIPYLFDYSIPKDPELADYFVDVIIRANENKKDIITAFDSSIRKYYQKTINPETGYKGYFIKFMGEEIRVDDRYSVDKSDELNSVISIIENEYMYRYLKYRLEED